MSTLIGIDLGTSACKVTVIDQERHVRSTESTSYPISSPKPGWAEQAPEKWWSVAEDTIRKAIEESGAQARDTIVGFTGQMHSFVMLDENDCALRPAILWCDERAQRQSAKVTAAVRGYVDITGNPPLAAFTLPQLLWVMENEPDIYSRCQRILVAKDYLRFRATGLSATDWTDGSGTGLLDSSRRRWSNEITKTLDISPDILPEVLDPIESGGELSKLLPGAKSVIGIGDQFAEAISAGVSEPGDLAISLGTSATLLGVSDHACEGAFCHAPKDRWLRLESLHSGGKALAWFAGLFGDSTSIADIANMARMAEPGANGVTFLPFLLAERRNAADSPPSAFVGMSLSTTLADLARAVLEGVAFELKRMHDMRGWEPSESVMTIKGGGSRSPLWCQIVSATFSRPYRIGSNDAAFGAAAVAGIRSGVWSGYSELSEAISQGNRETRMVDPDLAKKQTAGYTKYLEIVNRLKTSQAK